MKAEAVVVMLTVLGWLACIIGWTLNVIQVFLAMANPVTGLFILKCLGILIAPLGILLGWVGIFF